jgi:hypothetical protein
VVITMNLQALAAGPAPKDELLPASDVLLCVLREQLDATSPVTALTHQLGCLYRELITDPLGGERIRADIDAAAAEIDRWVAARLPRPRPGAFRHMHSAGRALSLLVEAWECAWWALHHYPRGDLRILQVWEHLAEMHDGFEVFREQVHTGAIALPKAWAGIDREKERTSA